MQIKDKTLKVTAERIVLNIGEVVLTAAGTPGGEIADVDALVLRMTASEYSSD